MSKPKPYYDRIVVRPDEAEDKTEGGIIIPDSVKERPAKGVIVAVGPGKKDEPMQPKEDDRIMYSKYSGTEIEIDGETLLVMRADEVLTSY